MMAKDKFVEASIDLSQRAFAFNSREFAFEAFDDEIVILNLTSGTYYALGGCALEAWDPLARTCLLSDIVAAIAARYGAAPETIAADLSGLADALVAERILLEASGAKDAIALGDHRPNGGYQPPRFEKHSDMEELLTLDPIHDVDPQKGWPHY